ncbi:MAG: UDP-glucose dehydrogenase family protein [Thermoleophilia bacterium]
MAQTQPPVGVIGVGYVGLVTAVCIAHLGHNVVCLDVDEAKIDALRAGSVPIYEPGLDDLMAGARERLSFTTSYDELCERARVLFIAVDTPPSPSGDADMSRVARVVREVSSRGGERLLVMKSTVPVGTGERVLAELESAGAAAIGYVSNPEFLREGAAVDDVLHPDRIVIGAYRKDDGDEVQRLFAGIETTVVRTTVATAEMIKYASNAFLATKISFINEIANVCEAVGADVRAVADGMGLDHRIGPHFLQAGIGYGGSCFPKDVQALKQLAGNSGYHFQLLNAVIEVNHLQKRRVVGKLQERVGRLRGKRVALLGLTFKPHTDDLREAASIVLASRLIAAGALVSAYDPMVAPGTRADLFDGVEIATSALEALDGADAAIVVTEWPEFLALDWTVVRERMRGRHVIDGRNVLDAGRVTAAGLSYDGIGTVDQPVAAGEPVTSDEAR